jgi:hypothetical protein
MIQTLALLATLGVIIWYSCETKKLRETSVKQTELQLTPYIVLDYKQTLIFGKPFLLPLTGNEDRQCHINRTTESIGLPDPPDAHGINIAR